MKFTHILTAAAFASLLAGGALAQTITDIGGIGNADLNSDGDLVLTFQNPSVTQELDVDIGPASDYYSSTNPLASENGAVSGGLTPGTTYTVAAYNANDLNTVFGSNANSASTTWAVVGGNGISGGPGSEPNESLWLTGTSLNSNSAALQTTLSKHLDQSTSSLAEDNSNGLASQDATSNNSRTSNSGFSIYVSSNYQGTTASLANNDNTGSTTLELYELLPTSSSQPGVDLGTFTLSTSELTFTPFVAVPEPSTYAAILGALTIGVVVLRRRFQGSAFNALV